jgi:acetyl esterase/lipase
MRILITLFTALFAVSPLLAQQQLPLYPEGKIPYNLKDTHKKYPKPTASPEGFLRKIGVPVLMYYPPNGTPNGGAVLIIPGGGYEFVSAQSEGAEAAALVNKLGFAAFVLHYRLPDTALVENLNRRWVPLGDAIQGMHTIKANASGLGIDTTRIGVMGFSAGGHIAAMLSANPDAHPYGELADRPKWTALIYPITSMYQGNDPARKSLLGGNGRITASTDTLFSPSLHLKRDSPPAFLLHCQDDDIVPASNALRYADALARQGGKADLHLYASGGHGFGVGTQAKGTVSNWPHVFEAWLKGR